MPDLSSLDDGTIKGSFTSIQCRSIRIGSYKVMPKERVVIASQGLRLKLPTVIEGKECILNWTIMNNRFLYICLYIFLYFSLYLMNI